MAETPRMSQKSMEKATRTYGRFIDTIKWSVPLIAVIVLFIVILIA